MASLIRKEMNKLLFLFLLINAVVSTAQTDCWAQYKFKLQDGSGASIGRLSKHHFIPPKGDPTTIENYSYKDGYHYLDINALFTCDFAINIRYKKCTLELKLYYKVSNRRDLAISHFPILLPNLAVRDTTLIFINGISQKFAPQFAPYQIDHSKPIILDRNLLTTKDTLAYYITSHIALQIPPKHPSKIALENYLQQEIHPNILFYVLGNRSMDSIHQIIDSTEGVYLGQAYLINHTPHAYFGNWVVAYKSTQLSGIPSFLEQHNIIQTHTFFDQIHTSIHIPISSLTESYQLLSQSALFQSITPELGRELTIHDMR
jgi:hypothetical protein